MHNERTDHHTPHIHHHTRVRIKEIVIPVLLFGLLTALLAGAIGYTMGFYAGEKRGETTLIQRLKQPDTLKTDSPKP